MADDLTAAMESIGQTIYLKEGCGAVRSLEAFRCEGCGAVGPAVGVSFGEREIIGCPTCANNLVASLRMMLGWGVHYGQYRLGYGEEVDGG